MLLHRAIRNEKVAISEHSLDPAVTMDDFHHSFAVRGSSVTPGYGASLTSCAIFVKPLKALVNPLKRLAPSAHLGQDSAAIIGLQLIWYPLQRACAEGASRSGFSGFRPPSAAPLGGDQCTKGQE